MTAEYDISLATLNDIPGILTLEEPNLPDSGGSLSVRLTADWFKHAILEKSVVVGRRNDEVVGYVLGTSLAAKSHVAIIQTMLRTFPPPPDCYLYGPVCVAETERGNSLAAALFEVLKTHMGGRPAMTFVRADNAASLRAHRKMGMRDLGTFTNERPTISPSRILVNQQKRTFISVSVSPNWRSAMGAAADPFVYHPDLRDRISDPLTSPSRSLTTEKLAALAKTRGLPVDWWYSDSEREAERVNILVGQRDTDLWVFAYGSLMWDPAFRFEEVRRAHVLRYARRFILKDIYGGRGTLDAPGLMVALDKGTGCDGLAFRISRENTDEETEVLWRRERIGPAYLPVFVEAITADSRMTTLTFVADHEADLIDASLTRAQQIEYCATGTGFMGSSLDYLKNISGQFTTLGIQDDEVSELLRETEAYINSRRTLPA